MDHGGGEFISQREAARRYRVSPGTLRDRIRRGELVTYTSPLNHKAHLLRVSDLEALRQIRPAEAVTHPVGSRA